MRNDRMLLASTLTPCPIRKRQQRNKLLRGIVAGLALQATVAIAGVLVLWFVCFGVVSK